VCIVVLLLLVVAVYWSFLQLDSVYLMNHFDHCLKLDCGSWATMLQLSCGSWVTTLQLSCGSWATMLQLGCGSWAITLQLEYARSFATIEVNAMIFVPAAGCWESPLVLCLEAHHPFHGHGHLD
jgi:hypothetical protein